jgi:hypothetical protein
MSNLPSPEAAAGLTRSSNTFSPQRRKGAASPARPVTPPSTVRGGGTGSSPSALDARSPATVPPSSPQARGCPFGLPVASIAWPCLQSSHLTPIASDGISNTDTFMSQVLAGGSAFSHVVVRRAAKRERTLRRGLRCAKARRPAAATPPKSAGCRLRPHVRPVGCRTCHTARQSSYLPDPTSIAARHPWQPGLSRVALAWAAPSASCRVALGPLRGRLGLLVQAQPDVVLATAARAH